MPNFVPSEYLYGLDLRKFNNPSYETMLLRKIQASRKLLQVLVHEQDMEDTVRINRVSEAIKFNAELLKELGYENSEIKSMLKALND